MTTLRIDADHNVTSDNGTIKNVTLHTVDLGGNCFVFKVPAQSTGRPNERTATEFRVFAVDQKTASAFNVWDNLMGGPTPPSNDEFEVEVEFNRPTASFPVRKPKFED